MGIKNNQALIRSRQVQKCLLYLQFLCDQQIIGQAMRNAESVFPRDEVLVVYKQKEQKRNSLTI